MTEMTKEKCVYYKLNDEQMNELANMLTKRIICAFDDMLDKYLDDID